MCVSGGWLLDAVLKFIFLSGSTQQLSAWDVERAVAAKLQKPVLTIYGSLTACFAGATYGRLMLLEELGPASMWLRRSKQQQETSRQEQGLWGRGGSLQAVEPLGYRGYHLGGRERQGLQLVERDQDKEGIK